MEAMKDEVTNHEGEAWGWLLELERMDWREHGHHRLDNRVIVRACPGELGAFSGAPYVRVSVELPQTKGGRATASGNSLRKACGRL